MELRRITPDGRQITIQKTRLNKKCKGTFTMKIDFGRGVFRAVWPKQNEHYRQGHSLDHVVIANGL